MLVVAMGLYWLKVSISLFTTIIWPCKYQCVKKWWKQKSNRKPNYLIENNTVRWHWRNPRQVTQKPVNGRGKSIPTAWTASKIFTQTKEKEINGNKIMSFRDTITLRCLRNASLMKCIWWSRRRYLRRTELCWMSKNPSRTCSWLSDLKLPSWAAGYHDRISSNRWYDFHGLHIAMDNIVKLLNIIRLVVKVRSNDRL